MFNIRNRHRYLLGEEVVGSIANRLRGSVVAALARGTAGPHTGGLEGHGTATGSRTSKESYVFTIRFIMASYLCVHRDLNPFLATDKKILIQYCCFHGQPESLSK